MIISRGFNCLKLAKNLNRGAKPSYNAVISRSQWVYRRLSEPTDKEKKTGEMIGAVLWGWVIYHFINDYDHVFGEYEEPDPSLWTDEELGIPPDDAGPYTRPS